MILRVCRRVLFFAGMLSELLTTLRAINFELDRAIVKEDILLTTATDIRTTLSEANAEADRLTQLVAQLNSNQGGISQADADAIQTDAQALKAKLAAIV